MSFLWVKSTTWKTQSILFIVFLLICINIFHFKINAYHAILYIHKTLHKQRRNIFIIHRLLFSCMHITNNTLKISNRYLIFYLLLFRSIFNFMIYDLMSGKLFWNSFIFCSTKIINLSFNFFLSHFSLQGFKWLESTRRRVFCTKHTWFCFYLLWFELNNFIIL